MGSQFLEPTALRLNKRMIPAFALAPVHARSVSAWSPVLNSGRAPASSSHADAKDLSSVGRAPLHQFATLLYFHGDASPSLLIGCPCPAKLQPSIPPQFARTPSAPRRRWWHDSFSWVKQIEEFMDKTGLPHARWTMDQVCRGSEVRTDSRKILYRRSSSSRRPMNFPGKWGKNG